MKRTAFWIVIAAIAALFAAQLDRVLVYSETAMLPKDAESYKVKEVVNTYFKDMANNTLLFAIFETNVTDERAWNWYWTLKNETKLNMTSIYDIWKTSEKGLKKLYDASKNFKNMYEGLGEGLANLWAAVDVIHYIMVINGLYSLDKEEAVSTFQALVYGTPLENMTDVAELLYDAVASSGKDPTSVDEVFTLTVAYRKLKSGLESEYAKAYLDCLYKGLIGEVKGKKYWLDYPMDFESIKNKIMDDIKSVEPKSVRCFSNWFAAKVGLPGDIVEEVVVSAYEGKEVNLRGLALKLILEKEGDIIKTLFLSKDWKATIIRLPTNDYETAKRVKEEAIKLGKGILSKAYLLGPGVLSVELQEANIEDARRVQELSHALVLVVLFLITRSIVASVIPFLVVGIGIIVGMALAYFVGLAFPIYHIAKTLMITTGLGLGMDYSIFILARFKEEATKGLSPKEAAAVAAKRAGHAVGVSALAASLGFASLALSGTLMLDSMGLTIPLVVLATAATAMTLLPEVLSKIGEKSWFWWPGRLTVREERPFEGRPRTSVLVAVFVLAIILTAYSLVFYINYKGTSDTTLFLPEGTEAYEALLEFAQRFPPGAWGPVYLVSLNCDCHNVLESLKHTPAVATVIMPEDVPSLKKDGINLIMVIPNSQPFSEEAMKLVEEIRHIREDKCCLVGGTPAELLDTKVLVTKSFWSKVAPFAITATMLVLLVSTRRLPPVVSAAFSLVAAISWAVTLSHYLSLYAWGSPLYWITPLIAFVATLGIGTDYNVFYISRVLEELEKNVKNAVWAPVKSAAPVILGLASIMASAYLGMLVARSVALRQMGLALGFSALFAAINATLLNPVTLSIIVLIASILKKR